MAVGSGSECLKGGPNELHQYVRVLLHITQFCTVRYQGWGKLLLEEWGVIRSLFSKIPLPWGWGSPVSAPPIIGIGIWCPVMDGNNGPHVAGARVVGWGT